MTKKSRESFGEKFAGNSQFEKKSNWCKIKKERKL